MTRPSASLILPSYLKLLKKAVRIYPNAKGHICKCLNYNLYAFSLRICVHARRYSGRGHVQSKTLTIITGRIVKEEANAELEYTAEQLAVVEKLKK